MNFILQPVGQEDDPRSFLDCRAAPSPFAISEDQVEWFRQLGGPLLAFYRAKNKLYYESVAGRQPAWVAQYLDNGKPESLVSIGRAKVFREQLPAVIRPDVLLTGDGYAICELDSVPGGFGLAARMANYYRAHGHRLAGDLSIEDGFLGATVGRASTKVRLAIVVSDESADYFNEMAWLARRLTDLGHEVVAIRPRDLRYTDEELLLVDGERRLPIDVVYRFMELFDLPNVSKSELLLFLAKGKRVAITPPPKAFLEEKLWFALFHHPALQPYWHGELSQEDWDLLQHAIPRTWIVDPTPLPPHAIIPGLAADGRAVQSWDDVANVSKRGRNLVLKPSGFSEQAWGSRGVVIGHDTSSVEWVTAINRALGDFPRTSWVLQEFRAPVRQVVNAFDHVGRNVIPLEGRARLTPYFFIEGDKARLSTILATICPIDKKKIHGMGDAVMTVCSW
ncbi:hypothetical protein [Elioraea sp.]|uniref:hypothetical protein n=1 Tax=Elioraea sp. TaxID=2185103 RepID=UPI0025C20676|nr:hypothetical protein [Elioraea sp.]